jgi:hypothetical protein
VLFQIVNDFFTLQQKISARQDFRPSRWIARILRSELRETAKRAKKNAKKN